eukprot:6206348-Pleurochrysis_carterae.AAC.1
MKTVKRTLFIQIDSAVGSFEEIWRRTAARESDDDMDTQQRLTRRRHAEASGVAMLPILQARDAPSTTPHSILTLIQLQRGLFAWWHRKHMPHFAVLLKLRPGRLPSSLALIIALLFILFPTTCALAARWTPPCSIQVIGVGGGGGNAVDRMVNALGDSPGLELVSMNTDLQALQRSRAHSTLQLGTVAARGLGAGGDPEMGREAALECIEKIQACVAGKDLVFITAGFGGGTGSGAAPVRASPQRKP